MAISCKENAATIPTRHRSLVFSWEALAMMFTILLVSSQTITFAVGNPIPILDRSTNSTNLTNGTMNATNTTSLCAEVECEPGLECAISEGNSAICVHNPDYNCSGIANNPVCGSDGLTYGNDCERNKKGVQLKKSGSCFSCQEQADNYKYDHTLYKYFQKNCNKLTLTEIVTSTMFSPKCSEEDPDVFLSDQLLDTVGPTCQYYWCSTPDGVFIEDTFSRDPTECSGRSSCIDNGHEYEDGEVFKSSTCGVCECLDGEITCINDFCGEPGNLTVDQLDILKNDIYQLFFFQYQYSKHTLIDLIHVHNNPAENVGEDTTCSMLIWKFIYYDQNGDNGLQNDEQHTFFDEVHDLINFSGFKGQLIVQTDTNGDKTFSFPEWFAYFTAGITEGSNSASVVWSCDQSMYSR